MGLEAVTYPHDLNILNPVTGDPRSEGDDHLRNIKIAVKNAFPGLAGRAFRWQTKSSNYTVLSTDNMSFFNIATTGITLALTAAATLGSGHLFGVHANGFDVTLDPNGAETINGATTIVVPNGTLGLVFCNGTSFVLSLIPVTQTAITGPFMFSGVISPSTITASQNDYNPSGLSGAGIVRVNLNNNWSITGLAGGAAGRIVALVQTTGWGLTLVNESASSIAANRFHMGNSQDLVFQEGMVLLWYDAAISRWRPMVGAIAGFSDVAPQLWDAADPTKRVQFVASNITSGQTRSVVFPDRTLSLGLIYYATETATTSGTAVTVTGLNTGLRRITIKLEGVSTNGTSIPCIQLGDSGGLETAGYSGSGQQVTTTPGVQVVGNTVGFNLVGSWAAGSALDMIIVLELKDNSVKWSMTGVGSISSGATSMAYAAGTKTLSNALDRISLTTVGGVNTFDAGSMSVTGEY